MNTIQKEKANLGGIAKVWAIPSYLVDILNQPKAPDTFTLPEGFKDQTIEIVPVTESGKFTENIKPSPSGQQCEALITFTIAKNSDTNTPKVGSLLLGPWALLIQDQNGLYRLVGSKAYPLRGSSASSTGAAILDLNHIAIQFAGASPFPAIFIANPF